MSALLDAVYILLGLLALPYVLARVALSARWRAGLCQRLGSVPRRAGGWPCVWIHAVSVGEANTVRPLVAQLEERFPDWEVRVSTTTNTGQRVAQKLFGADRCFYFPLDLSFIIGRTFRRVRPDVVVLVELELWPNFIRVARRRGVPLVVVNGRMREQTVKRYHAAHWLFGPAFDAAGQNLFCVQNHAYADRFERVGAPPEKILVTGNMKYDAVHTQVAPEQQRALRAALGLKPSERVWAAACTWPGEEQICLRVHRRLLEEDPALRLVIAPRHIERASEVERAITASGFACHRRSMGNGPSGPAAVGLLDTIGELGYVYAFAEFVFVGKSLTIGGGHNMLEPAALGAPPVFGPLTENFRSEAGLLLEKGAAECVADEETLHVALLRLMQDESCRRNCARLGREVVNQQRGASARNLEIVARLLAQCRPFH